MRFEKWQALGNDYLIVERDELPWELTPKRIRRICDPHFGAGSDGSGRVSAGGREWRFQHVAIGNPQCVIDAGEEVEDLDLAAIGPEIERSELFPNRTNVSFVRIDGSEVRARIFERGVGETLSSGTGASGAAVAAFLRRRASPISVRLDGGELTVEVDDDLRVRLTGTAEPVFTGELAPQLVDALAAAGP